MHWWRAIIYNWLSMHDTKVTRRGNGDRLRLVSSIYWERVSLRLSDARPLNDYRSTHHEDSSFMENVTGPLLGFFLCLERERKRIDREGDERG